MSHSLQDLTAPEHPIQPLYDMVWRHIETEARQLAASETC